MSIVGPNFREFERELLKAACRASKNGENNLSLRQLVDQTNLEMQNGWGASALRNFETEGLVKGNYGAAGTEGEMIIGITGRGMRQAEIWIDEDRPKTIRERLGAVQRSDWIAFGALVVSIIALFKSGN